MTRAVSEPATCLTTILLAPAISLGVAYVGARGALLGIRLRKSPPFSKGLERVRSERCGRESAALPSCSGRPFASRNSQVALCFAPVGTSLDVCYSDDHSFSQRRNTLGSFLKTIKNQTPLRLSMEFTVQERQSARPEECTRMAETEVESEISSSARDGPCSSQGPLPADVGKQKLRPSLPDSIRIDSSG